MEGEREGRFRAFSPGGWRQNGFFFLSFPREREKEKKGIFVCRARLTLDLLPLALRPQRGFVSPAKGEKERKGEKKGLAAACAIILFAKLLLPPICQAIKYPFLWPTLRTKCVNVAYTGESGRFDLR